MAQEIEISLLDLRYESCRIKHPRLEGRLLASIAERGIEQPLEGVAAGESGLKVLINGFKRYRCARKLQLSAVPYLCLGGDEAVAIMNLLRASNNRALGILEQARFLDELCLVGEMSVAGMAAELSRSKAWVSMRLGLITEMSPAVSAKKLSLREIEQLAHGFFRGPESFRQEILKGNLALSLEQIREVAPDPEGCSEFERVLLGDLELVQKYMQRVMGKSQDPRIKSRGFFAQSHLLSAGILSRCPAFTKSLKHLHDRSGQA